MSRAYVRGVIAGIASIAIAVGCAQAGQSVLEARDHPSAPSVPFEGKTFKIVNGAAYEVRGNNLHYAVQLYDPDFYGKNYVVEGSTVYRYAHSKKYPVRTSMTEGFENATTIRDLIGPARGWSSVTVQGPKTATVRAYVELRQRLIAGTGDFLDNRVEPSSAVVHGGTRSLRAYALPAGLGLAVSKASLECELLHFRKGDHFWLQGWFNIVQGSPTGILDLESSFVHEYPGLRILLSETLQPRVELKWADKPTYAANADVRLPRNKWIQIRLHAYLSDGPDGHVELWADGERVINARGQTLPLADTVYDRLEIGISANTARAAAEVFVDDLKLDRQPVF